MPASLEVTLACRTTHLLAHTIDDTFLSEIGDPPHGSEKEERRSTHAPEHLEEEERERDEVRGLRIRREIRRLARGGWILYDMHDWNEGTLPAQRVEDGSVNEVFDAATVDGRVEWRVRILWTVELLDLASACP